MRVKKLARLTLFILFLSILACGKGGEPPQVLTPESSPFTGDKWSLWGNGKHSIISESLLRAAIPGSKRQEG